MVNVGGTFGFKGAALSSAYGATKWALRGFTHSAALEAGPHGVRVNSVNPGGVDGTRLRRQLAEAAERTGAPYRKIYDDFAARSALGRMSSDIDVANAVLFLLSDAAGNITGQDLFGRWRHGCLKKGRRDDGETGIPPVKLGLDGQTVLLTGATSGMGPDIARAFAEEGARLGLLTRQPEAVADLVQELSAQRVRIDAFACDITDADSCSAAAEAAEAGLGQPFALINLAGGSGPIGKTGVETTREEFHDILDLNTTGIFNMIRAVAPAMMRAGRGADRPTWAAPSACAAAPGGWPIRPRNGASGASPRASHWNWARTESQ